MKTFIYYIDLIFKLFEKTGKNKGEFLEEGKKLGFGIVAVLKSFRATIGSGLKMLMFLLLGILSLAVPLIIFSGIVVLFVYVCIAALWNSVANNYETGLIVLIIGTFVYLTFLGAKKIGWKRLFIIYLILSILRLALYFWVDPEFMISMVFSLLGILAAGVFLFFLFSYDWSKVKVSTISRRNFLPLYIVLLLIFLLILFQFIDSRSNFLMEEVPIVSEKDTTDVVIPMTENSEAQKFINVEFLRGGSIWGFLQQQGVEEDSLMVQSIAISKLNGFPSFILDKDNEKIWVTKMESNSLQSFYKKRGKKYVTIVPIGATACWETTKKKLTFN